MIAGPGLFVYITIVFIAMHSDSLPEVAWPKKLECGAVDAQGGWASIDVATFSDASYKERGGPWSMPPFNPTIAMNKYVFL